MGTKIHAFRVGMMTGLSLLSLMFLASVWTTHPAQARAVRTVSSICAWDKLSWTDMSGPERELWSRLGWSQSRWDSDNTQLAPVSSSKNWNELSADEQGAASRLGFTVSNWDIACTPAEQAKARSDSSRTALDSAQ